MHKHDFRGGTMALAAAGLLAFGAPGVAASNDVMVELEQPVHGEFTTGIGIVRGWAVAPSGIDRVELYINESPDQADPNQLLAYGGSREGVCAAIDLISGYPDCSPVARPGFASAYNFNLLPDGENTFTVRAYDNEGNYSEESATFTSQSLGEEFVADGERISLPAFIVDGVRKSNPGDDQAFDIEFAWSTESQRFVMSRITEFEPLPFIALDPPVGLTATTDDGAVELSWTEGAGPASERWFIIERKFDSLTVSTDYNVVGVVPQGVTSFVDEAVTLNVISSPGQYTYRVLAAEPWATRASNEVTVNQSLGDGDLPDIPDIPDLDFGL
ncbi:hypothetical protein [Thioalkalivibrio sp. ALE11]|uniref:hypothetical protein n=1 Tax=Thioalkalivibrio sp. ALE11 TaxID=1265494 RepID=UPI00037A0210|nr:hypothetical protein [Thioalkalivibrio sp. ALE11]